MNRILSLTSRNIFVKTQLQIFPSLRSELRSGKVRGKCLRNVRESQGIPIQLTGGNPYVNLLKLLEGVAN